MTDLETMRAMLTGAKIEFTETAHLEPIGTVDGSYQAGSVTLEVKGGYPGFYSTLIFHADGSLAGIEAYE